MPFRPPSSTPLQDRIAAAAELPAPAPAERQSAFARFCGLFAGLTLRVR